MATNIMLFLIRKLSVSNAPVPHSCSDPTGRRWCQRLPRGEQGPHPVSCDVDTPVRSYHHRPGALPQEVHRRQTHVSGKGGQRVPWRIDVNYSAQ